MLATVACKDDKTDDVPKDTPKATIATVPTNVAIGANGAIPADAVLPTTMRIVSGYTGEGNIIPKDGCGEFESGSVIDVEVNK